MPELKNGIKRLSLYFLLWGFNCFLDVMPTPVHGLFLNDIAEFYHLSISVLLAVFVMSRISNKGTTRNMLSAIGWLMVLSSFLQALKFIPLSNSHVAARYIWYSYYISIILIPCFSVIAAISTGYSKKRGYIVERNAVIVISALLLLAVFTNDLHELVFVFNSGIENWETEYTHNVLYYAICGWFGLLIISTLIILYKRCRISAVRKLVWLPCIPAVIGTAYGYLLFFDIVPYINGQRVGTFVETFCFMTAAFWGVINAIGLIPENRHDDELLQSFSVNMLIADRNFDVEYSSYGVKQITREQMAEDKPVPLDENTLLHRNAVSGGYGYWQQDLTELNSVNSELQEVYEKLLYEAKLKQLENELTEQQERIETRSHLYDKIAEYVNLQAYRIITLVDEAEKNTACYDRNMALVCFMSAHIKRVANIVLMGEEDPKIPLGQLFLSFSESLKYLSAFGIPCEIIGNSSLTAPVDRVVAVYRFFENTVEENIENIGGVFITAAPHGVFKMTLEGVSSVSIPDECREFITAETEDDTSYVRFLLDKGGECI